MDGHGGVMGGWHSIYWSRISVCLYCKVWYCLWLSSSVDPPSLLDSLDYMFHPVVQQLDLELTVCGFIACSLHRACGCTTFSSVLRLLCSCFLTAWLNHSDYHFIQWAQIRMITSSATGCLKASGCYTSSPEMFSCAIAFQSKTVPSLSWKCWFSNWDLGLMFRWSSESTQAWYPLSFIYYVYLLLRNKAALTWNNVKW